MGTQIPKKVPMGTRVPKWGPIWEQWFWIKDHSAVGSRLYIAVVDKMLINTKIQWSIQRSSSRSAHQLDMVFNGH